jgi:hypothetical protein
MADTLGNLIETAKGYAGDSGTCSVERAKKYINQARSLLWNKREWNTTAEYVCIKCADGCLTLPNRYEQIRLAWVNGNPASLADEWFNATNAYSNLYNKGNSCHRQIVEVGGKHVLFRDYTARPYQIAVLAENIDDVGVELLFEAQDQYGSYKNVKATTVKSPNVGLSVEQVVGIRAASKPKTKGRIRVYAYDPTIDAKLLIAIYHPEDINPTFRRFNIPSKTNCLTLYASKKYKDLEDDNELVEFTAEAMYFAILAINSRENRRAQEFLINLDLAVKEEEKSMEGDEIPTAAPLRIVNYQRAQNLMGSYMGSLSSSDYFFDQNWY